MKNNKIRGLVRFLFTLLGAGLGVLLSGYAGRLLGSTVVLRQNPYFPYLLAAGLALVGGVLFFALSQAVYQSLSRRMERFAARTDAMSTREIVYTVAGLILGLVPAYLTSRLILAPGASLATLTLSALVYLALGWMGVNIARRRLRKRRESGKPKGGDALETLLGEEETRPAARMLALDSSVLIDGRLPAVLATGFLQGELLLPEFIQNELRHLADSAEDERRIRGRRGLDCAEKLSAAPGITLVPDTDSTAAADVDARLLRLCTLKGADLLTNDTNLIRAAAVAGVVTLNLNALAEALKSPLAAGDRVDVVIRKSGRERSQGVGYLEDGTMLVVEEGANHIGETLSCEVTSVLRTAAGKMVFLRIRDN